jgi:hypothetical protein
MKKLLLATCIALFSFSCIDHSLLNEIHQKGDTIMLKSDSTRVIVIDTITYKTSKSIEFNYVVKYVVRDTNSLLYGITTTVKDSDVLK